MNRDLIYEIPESLYGHKISELLHQKGFSNQNLTALKKMDHSVMINGRWEYLNYRLRPGDLLEIHIQEEEVSEKIPPVKLPFPIIYEDEDITVVNKPAGMPIHPSMKNYENTLGNAAAYYYASQGKPFVYRCVNRLDKDTTGLTILAKHMLSCSVLYDAMSAREIHREYLAIVEGCDIPEEGIIDLPLGRKTDSAIERMVDPEHGEKAVTHYKVIDRKEPGPEMEKGLAFISLKLETGRTHQIRVHMKAIGHPLIGDFLYYPENHLMSRQALHSYRLDFIHPITGKPLTFTAPIPEDMRQFFPCCKLKVENDFRAS